MIRSAHSGLLLTEGDQGAVSQQAAASGVPAPSQLWDISLLVGGYLIVNTATGNALALFGSNIFAAALWADTPLAFFFFDIRDTAIIYTGNYLLFTPGWNGIDVSGASTAPGANIQLYSVHDEWYSQKFILSQNTPKTVTIKNGHSFKALDVAGGVASSGANIQLDYFNGSLGQSFLILPSGDGWFILRSALGTYVAATSDSAGANLFTTGERSQAQRFRLQATYVWSSGITELDEKLAGIMNQLGRDGDILLKCYNYVRWYGYQNGSLYPSGNWVPGMALEMINVGSGNCYRFAALLDMLLKYNGYNTQAIAGGVLLSGGRVGPHSWVELYSGGQVYVLDAEAPHDIPNRNFYMITYAQAPVTYIK